MNPQRSDNYHCPRCKNKDIIDFEFSFKCPYCMLNFDKSDYEFAEDDSYIIAVEEKDAFLKALKLHQKE